MVYHHPAGRLAQSHRNMTKKGMFEARFMGSPPKCREIDFLPKLQTWPVSNPVFQPRDLASGMYQSSNGITRHRQIVTSPWAERSPSSSLLLNTC